VYILSVTPDGKEKDRRGLLKPINIVLVSVDTMRPDHLGCYGYFRPTSPNIDGMAAQGAVFTQAIAPHIPTIPSHTTFYTGLHALAHNIAVHNGPAKLNRGILMLPQMLQQRGYATAAVDNLTSMHEGKSSWFSRGYDYYSGFRYQPGAGRDGKTQSDVLTERSVELLELLQHEPFFFFVHYWDPHSPYWPSRATDRMFYDEDEHAPKHTSMEPVFALADEYYRSWLGDMKMDGVTDLEFILAQYDATIRDADTQVGRLLTTLDGLGLADRTLVVVVSDHGEAFGEGGLYFGHHGLYDGVLRIAMIMRLPGVIRIGVHVDAMVAGFDLVPTILEAVGLEPPYDLPYELTGKSLWPLLEESETVLHAELFLSEGFRQASYGVRTEQWKFILPVTHNLSGMPLPDIYGRPRTPTPQLFNLQADPDETCDVYKDRPEVSADLESRLKNWLGAEGQNWDTGDPIRTQLLPGAFEDEMNKVRERSGIKTSGIGRMPTEPSHGQTLERTMWKKISDVVPVMASVLVVSRGEEALLHVGGRQAWHFPQAEDGGYAGYYPADSAEAITHLEALRAKGAQYLLFPATAFWWLEHYVEFAHYLHQQYDQLLDDDNCVLFSLTGSRSLSVDS
jgi:arylsulfatase A-like enzyme